MSKFTMVDMTVDEAAKFVRQIAETTSQASQNWENFEQIVKSIIQNALDAGRKFGQEEKKS